MGCSLGSLTRVMSVSTTESAIATVRQSASAELDHFFATQKKLGLKQSSTKHPIALQSQKHGPIDSVVLTDITLLLLPTGSSVFFTEK